MQRLWGLLALALALPAFSAVANKKAVDAGKHHHGKHHHNHHKHGKHEPEKKEPKNDAAPAKAGKTVTVAKAAVPAVAAVHTESKTESSIVSKMKQLEARLASKAKAEANAKSKGHILVNGPLPVDFNERFAQAV